MNAAQSQDLRKLNIQFEAYGADDPDFKKELIVLMLDNIKELCEAVCQSFDWKNAAVFETAAHKVKSTLNLLNDQEFNNCIQDLKEIFDITDEAAIKRKMNEFSELSDGIIRSLEYEVRLLRTG
ncbi:MAG TPA: hypothetical protein VD816_10585 [Ohtaekwangia sp.]|nr:hypothetical protein [Ohtaekwangia sp.]